MQLSEAIYNGGLVEEITRITGATIAVYSNKDRVARLNAALDRYWFLASEAAPKGTLDDTNNTALPLETQNLVSGTNAYKISSFTNKVLQIAKLTVLNSSGLEIDLVREDFDEIDEFYNNYSTDTDKRATPEYWTKIGDYIYLRPCPNYASTSGLRAYVNRELSKFSFVTFTVTIASPGVFTATAHGLANGDALILETDGALPTGLTADTTLYYVISTGLTADAFEVSTTIGGSAVNTSGTQSGNHKFIKATKEPGIPVIHHNYLARQVALPFLIEKGLPSAGTIKQLILEDEISITKYWSHRDKDLRKIMTFRERPFR